MLSQSLNTVQTKANRRKLSRVFRKSHKRVVRYGLLTANFLVLLAVVFFVVHNSGSGEAASSVITANSPASDSAPTNPLDQVSSADIAVNVARMTNLAETVAVTNHADSFNSELEVAHTDTAVVAKPQIVATAQPTVKDIKTYVTQAGDTLSAIAAKYGVTSDSIRWSNGLTATNTLAAGKTLTIPPLNGIVYTVKAGDTADNLAQKFSANKEQLIAFNDAELTGIKVGQRIVIPDGTQPNVTVAAPAYSGYAFGVTAVYGFNGYDFGWCTWYAANRRAAIGRPVPGNLGNAYSWYILAQRAGLATGLSAQVGAVAVNQAGNHVSVVEQVNGDGSFWVSEMNSRGQVSINDPTPAGGWNRIDYKFYPSPGNLKFVY